MNKPIIIDGVDVSECEYCIIAGAEFPECRIRLANFEIKCEGYNCYFKQLQRLRAENEQLKEEVADLEDLAKFKTQRIEELQKYIEKMDKPKIEVVDSDIAIENIKLKQALEEIRDTVKLVCKDLCNYCDWQNTDSCEPNEYNCGEFIKIKDKINEVLK